VAAPSICDVSRSAIWPHLLAKPEPAQHLVQLYGPDERHLVQNVCRYFADGLLMEEGIAAVATPEHCAAFIRGLNAMGVDVEAAQAEDRALFFDSGETLAMLAPNGVPDASRFAKIIGGVAHRAGAGGRRSVRTYCETVGLLWLGGKIDEAIRLEELWNRFLETANLTLLCGYAIDIFSDNFHMEGLDAVLCAHTHLLPSGHAYTLETSIRKALRDAFGAKLEGLDQIMNGDFRPAWAIVPNAEAIILWLRRNLPDSARDVMARAHAYYRVAEGLALD
jgi:hypothetical protein